jgi:hypothetical protein
MVDNSPNRFFLQYDQSSPSPMLGARRTGIAPRNHHPPRPLARPARPSLSPPAGFRMQVFWPVRGLLRSWEWATVASRVSLRACEGYRSCTKNSQHIATTSQAETYLPFCVRVRVIHGDIDWHVGHVHGVGGYAGLPREQTSSISTTVRR